MVLWRTKTLISLSTLWLLIVVSCGGGGNGTTPTPEEEGVLPLTIVSFVASPLSGPSPLGTTFTVTVSGGTLPITYYWDFNNDGAFDATTPPSASRTATVYYQYQLKAEDALTGVSTYNAVVEAVDDKNKRIKSNELTITVTSAPRFSVNVSITSDFVEFVGDGEDMRYIFVSGQPVYFRASVQASGSDSGPYTFAWDFDGDGRVDSTLQNAQYTFTVTGDNQQMVFSPKLIVTDAQLSQVIWTPPISPQDPNYPYVVVKEIAPTPSGIPELIVSTSPPTEVGNVIRIVYNSLSDDPTERIPRLSVSASVKLTEPGTPPYSFLWDFTGDGTIDSRTPQATVPYFDNTLNVMVNPYLLQGSVSTKQFEMTLQFSDSAGHTERRSWLVIVTNTARQGQLNPVTAEVTVDLDGDDDFDIPATPEEQQYKVLSENQVLDYVEDADGNRIPVGFTVRVQVKASGSSGRYEFAIDPFGNGAWAFDPDGDGILNWDPAFIPGSPDVEFNLDPSSVDASITFSSPDTAVFSITYWGGLDPQPPSVQFPDAFLPGYKGIQVRVNALDEAGIPISSVVIPAPVNLVSATAKNFTTDSVNPLPRSDFGFIGRTTTEGRRAYIIGGMDGNTAHRSVQMIFQSYDANTEAGRVPFGSAFLLTNRLPLLEPVGQMAFGFHSQTDRIYVMGGYNNISGTLSTVESLMADDGSISNPTQPWTTAGTFGDRDIHIRFADSASAIVRVFVNGTPTDAEVFFIAGGLDSSSPLGNVISNVWMYFPQYRFWSTNFLGDAPMPTPRYDFTAVVVEPPTGFSYLYVIGGRTNDGTSINTVERMRFEIEGQLSQASWESVPDMQFPRAGASAEVINGKIYVFGGSVYPSGGTGTPQFVSSSEVFNPDQNIWSLFVPLPEASVGSIETAAFPSFEQGGGTWYPNDTIWVYGTVDSGTVLFNEYYIEDFRAID